MAVSWDDAVAYALSLPDTQMSTSHGKPVVQVASNGRFFLFTGHESQTSFGIALDLDTIELLKETDPATFWQTPHYKGSAGLLVRYATTDPDRVLELIARSRDWTAAKPKLKPRRSR